MHRHRYSTVASPEKQCAEVGIGTATNTSSGKHCAGVGISTGIGIPINTGAGKHFAGIGIGIGRGIGIGKI